MGGKSNNRTKSCKVILVEHVSGRFYQNHGRHAGAHDRPRKRHVEDRDEEPRLQHAPHFPDVATTPAQRDPEWRRLRRKIHAPIHTARVEKPAVIFRVISNRPAGEDEKKQVFRGRYLYKAHHASDLGRWLGSANTDFRGEYPHRRPDHCSRKNGCTRQTKAR